jgi:hypothetical protein
MRPEEYSQYQKNKLQQNNPNNFKSQSSVSRDDEGFAMPKSININKGESDRQGRGDKIRSREAAGGMEAPVVQQS